MREAHGNGSELVDTMYPCFIHGFYPGVVAGILANEAPAYQCTNLRGGSLKDLTFRWLRHTKADGPAFGMRWKIINAGPFLAEGGEESAILGFESFHGKVIRIPWLENGRAEPLEVL